MRRARESAVRRFALTHDIALLAIAALISSFAFGWSLVIAVPEGMEHLEATLPAACGVLLAITFVLLFRTRAGWLRMPLSLIAAYAGVSLLVGIAAILVDVGNGPAPAPEVDYRLFLPALPALAVLLLAITGMVLCQTAGWPDQVVLAVTSAVLGTTGVAITFVFYANPGIDAELAVGLVGPSVAFGMIALAALGWRMRRNRSGYFSTQTPGWRAIRLSLPIAMLIPVDRFLLNTNRQWMTGETALRADMLLSLINLMVIVLLFHWAMGRISRQYQALTRQQSRMALAIEAPGAGVFDWNVQTGDLDWTPNAERSIGLRPGELNTIDLWRAMIDPEDRAAISQRIREVAAVHGDSFSCRFRLRTRTGEIRTFEGSVRCFYDDEGTLSRAVGMNLDVTERDQREAALVAKEAQLRSIIDNVPDALIVIDAQGVIRKFSAAAERMFGYAENAVLGANVTMLMPPDQSAMHAGMIGKYLGSGEKRIIGRAVTLSGRRGDGEVFPVELTVGEAHSQDERMFIAFVRDITERVAAEQRLEELRDEFAHSARLSAMGEMAAGLAHELNQPLAAGANFLGAAEMIVERDQAEGDTDPELMALLGQARGQLLRAGEIIRRLRDFLAKGGADMRVEPLERTIREAIALGMVGHQQHQIETRYTVEPGATAMLADRVQVQQVLVNLLRNAAEAVRTCPRDRRIIAIAARPVSEEMLEVSVSDRGPGLPPVILDQLYTPFLSTKGEGGLGIGLSICRRIVEAHGGTMVAANLPEGGARIAFTLPKSHPPRREDRG